MEISNYDILHKAMWNSYEEIKKSNFARLPTLRKTLVSRSFLFIIN